MAMDEQALDRYEFGRRLRAARDRAGLSMQALGWAAGISDEAVRLFETGQRSPRLETAMRLAAGLGVPIEDLLPDDYMGRYRPPDAVLEWIGQRAAKPPAGQLAKGNESGDRKRAGSARSSSARSSDLNARRKAKASKKGADQRRRKSARDGREGGI